MSALCERDGNRECLEFMQDSADQQSEFRAIGDVMPCYAATRKWSLTPIRIDVRSVSHRFQDHALRSLPIPFAIENPLPGTEIEAAVGHRNDDLVANGDRSQMGRRVILTRSAVVTVLAGVPRRHRLLEPIEDILPQIWLMVVNEDRRRDVHRGGEDHALPNSRGGAASLDRIGD